MLEGKESPSIYKKSGALKIAPQAAGLLLNLELAYR